MTRKEQVQAELEALRAGDGKLIPEDVVEWARINEQSELHKRLEWDNDKAGHQWRLQQVRQLIRVVFVDDNEERTAVSLRVDRVAGGGYRKRDDVLVVPTFRAHWLDDLAKDAAYFVMKHHRVREMIGDEVAMAASEMLDVMGAFVARHKAARESEREEETEKETEDA